MAYSHNDYLVRRCRKLVIMQRGPYAGEFSCMSTKTCYRKYCLRDLFLCISQGRYGCLDVKPNYV